MSNANPMAAIIQISQAVRESAGALAAEGEFPEVIVG
jgi:hypothetical protein